jgi:hypothetical protein
MPLRRKGVLGVRAVAPDRILLLLEAVCHLLLARIMLQIFPFRRLRKYFNRLPRNSAGLPDTERGRIRDEIRWAIDAAASRLPGQTACFPRGIAAQAMCRKRGIQATLCYGATNLPAKGLTAHVWVMDGNHGIVGHQIAEDYRIIARFPE